MNIRLMTFGASLALAVLTSAPPVVAGGLPDGADPTLRVTVVSTQPGPEISTFTFVAGNAGQSPYRAQLRVVIPEGVALDQRPADHPAVKTARRALDAARARYLAKRTSTNRIALTAAIQRLQFVRFGVSPRLRITTTSSGTQHLTGVVQTMSPKVARVTKMRVRVSRGAAAKTALARLVDGPRSNATIVRLVFGVHFSERP